MRLYLLFALALASDITAFRTLISKNGVNEVYRINSVTGKGDIEILITKTENGLQLQASNADTNVPFLSGTIGIGQNFLNKPCFYEETCQLSDETTFTVKDAPNGLRFIFKTDNRSERLMDCYNFGDWNWYGGPERRVQTWPIENMVIDSSNPYVSRKDDNFGVAERYWLNSEGSYIFLNDENPLFVSQNEESTQGQFCFISDLEGPYFNRTSNTLEYVWSYRDDPKSAHLDAINTYLGKPTGHPNSKMISEPIWTTWAKYKRDIDDATVLEFAKSIRDQGYTNGQLEIDDAWEKCYGAQEFTEDKFSDITETVQQVKDMGFRVTLWVHPFVNEGCETNAQVGNDNDYFVRGLDGLNNATWWNGDKIGHQIDFTNPEAAEWWSSRLRKLQENPQIDSFKFDAGESDYGQQPSVYPNVDQNLIPNILTQSYIKTCAKFGDLIEVRSAWRTQDLPIFVRMLDKDTSWEMENGLPTLVTTLLQLNMNGYTMVLPDMIGGNGYSGELPSPELLVRWTQANTFMPAMQFSYLPWEITSTEFDVAEIVKKYVDIHAEYSDIIISAMEKSIQDGTPVNPPIWWKDPTDPIALACNDEYLVGEDILVAPVLENNSRSRSVYLPKGHWVDGHNGTVYEGPITLDYAADIDILPFFLST